MRLVALGIVAFWGIGFAIPQLQCGWTISSESVPCGLLTIEENPREL